MGRAREGFIGRSGAGLLGAGLLGAGLAAGRAFRKPALVAKVG